MKRLMKELQNGFSNPDSSTISVIVPVYNVESYLCRCVDSILAQNYEKFDVILIDDDSDDRCPDICDMYALKDNRVFVIHRNEHGGVSVARNEGVEWAFTHSNSEWICFIDSDDWVHPQYLEILYQSVINSNVDLAIVGFTKTDKVTSMNQIVDCQCNIRNAIEFLAEDSYSGGVLWNKIYRKSLFEDVRFPDGKIFEDEYTSYKLLYKAKKAAVLPCVLYYYFQRKGSISSIFTRETFQHYDAICKEVSFLGSHGYKEQAAKLLDLKMDFFDFQYNHSMPSGIYFKVVGYFVRWRLVFTGFGVWKNKHFFAKCGEAVCPGIVHKLYNNQAKRRR